MPSTKPHYIEHQAQFAEQALTHFKNGTPEWVQSRLDEVAGALRRGAEKSEADASTIASLQEQVEALKADKNKVNAIMLTMKARLKDVADFQGSVEEFLLWAEVEQLTDFNSYVKSSPSPMGEE